MSAGFIISAAIGLAFGAAFSSAVMWAIYGPPAWVMP